MAEALGVAAGVAGMTTLAFQLFDGARKLCDLLRSMKDFPANVQNLQDQLAILMLALNKNQAILDQSSSCYSNDAVSRCQVLVRHLRGILNDVQTYTTRPGWPYSPHTIKAWRRKRQIDELTCRIRVSCELLRTVNQIDFQ